MGSPWLLGMPFTQQFTSGWDTEANQVVLKGIVPGHNKLPSHEQTGERTMGKRELVRRKRGYGIGQIRLWNRANPEL